MTQSQRLHAQPRYGIDTPLLDNDSLYRFIYVPYVIATLVWDYAETITDMAAYLHINATKPLSRAVKELHKQYDRDRAEFIDNKDLAGEQGNGYEFEKGVSRITDQMLLNIKLDLRREYPDLDADYMDFLIAVYQCDITHKALMLYCERQAKSVSQKLGCSIGRMMPDQIYSLGKLVREFIGDKPASARFAELSQSYVETLATQIGLIEMDITDKK